MDTSVTDAQYYAASKRAQHSLIAALIAAEMKHPGWHTDWVRQGAIVSEEAGELMKACLEFVEKKEKSESIGHATYEIMIENIEQEAAQTGAMCLRLLTELYLRKNL